MTRDLVVAEAKTWLRTPYHPRARVKGVGVDCANLPAAVYEACGLIPNIDPEYSSQWMFHRDEEIFLHHVLDHSTEIALGQVGSGDFIIWKFGRVYSHSAIVIDWPEVIHASGPDKMVTLANAAQDYPLADRTARYFTLWGKAE